MRPRRWMPRGVLAAIALAVALLVVLPGPPADAQTPEPTPNGLGSYTVPHDWPLKPTGLGAGDEFRLLFMTHKTRDASATDIATYDAFVQAAADGTHTEGGGVHASIRPYASLFKVVGSTATVDARDHTETNPNNGAHPNVPIYWLNGPRVATGKSGFWSSSWEFWSQIFRRNEAGTQPPGDWHWTDTMENGAKDATRYLGAASVRRGRFQVLTTDTGPISHVNTVNTQSHSFYAISPVFRVDNPPGYSLTLSWDNTTTTPPTIISEGGRSYPGGGLITMEFTLNQAAPAGGIDLGRIASSAPNAIVHGTHEMQIPSG